MLLWNLLADVAHNWWANTLYALSFGLLFGLFLANEYHKVRCNSKAHRRNWFKELLGKYD